MGLRTACIKHAIFKIVKIRTGGQYVEYFYKSEKLNWAAQNLRLGRRRPAGHGLDIVALQHSAAHLAAMLREQERLFSGT